MGAGATGPFLVLRLASVRLGVGRPLGSVLRVPVRCGVHRIGRSRSATAPRRRPLRGPCFRPSSFTVARLLRRWPADLNGPGGECAIGPTLTGDERLSVMDDDGPTALDDEPTGPAPGRIQMPAMRVLVAPDCYGDSLSAVEAAAAIATGWSRSRPGDMFIVAPQSDGGPGFVKVLASRLGETRRLRVCGPLDAIGGSASGCSIPARRPPTWSVRKRAVWRCLTARPRRRPRWRPTAGESGSSSPRRCGRGRRRSWSGLAEAPAPTAGKE